MLSKYRIGMLKDSGNEGDRLNNGGIKDNTFPIVTDDSITYKSGFKVDRT